MMKIISKLFAFLVLRELSFVIGVLANISKFPQGPKQLVITSLAIIMIKKKKKTDNGFVSRELRELHRNIKK